jgi:hypothetical protein
MGQSEKQNLDHIDAFLLILYEQCYRTENSNVRRPKVLQMSWEIVRSMTRHCKPENSEPFPFSKQT